MHLGRRQNFENALEGLSKEVNPEDFSREMAQMVLKPTC